MKTSFKRALAPVVVVGALLVTAAPPASAADQTHNIPAGFGCEGFNLRLEVFDPGRKERFLPAKEELVRSITAGKGNLLRLTNYGPGPDWVAGESITVKTGGSVEHRQYNDDGTQIVTGTGHNLIVLFPEDDPEVEGPSTKLYVGKVRFFYNPKTGYTDILSFKGRERDICAELS